MNIRARIAAVLRQAADRLDPRTVTSEQALAIVPQLGDAIRGLVDGYERKCKRITKAARVKA